MTKNYIKHIVVKAVLFVAFIPGNTRIMLHAWFVCLLICLVGQLVFASDKYSNQFIESCPKEKSYTRFVQKKYLGHKWYIGCAQHFCHRMDFILVEYCQTMIFVLTPLPYEYVSGQSYGQMLWRQQKVNGPYLQLLSNTVAPPKSIQLYWLMPTVRLVPGLSLEERHA